ncbi:CPBP family intramembrane metalloprotease [Nocardia sp. NBC_00508]|uniref:CPBP family intramembrane glutamic endopeptidase n=1 Tax=Nocardia sp. NBC_00508 TaxID=2975992 RepID=UPI002E80C37C|nr:CPBP family intramembrane glutamic endopeptidase [Nocardia sp. NBC_00508]WUD66614.1 CPBP family intramembrane metalloprotease [Nocardia sp. NBC_00508]
MRIRLRRRVYLGVEYAALFFGGTAAYNTVLRGRSPIPALLALAGGASLYLRRSSDFDRAALWRSDALRAHAHSMAAWAGSSAVALTAAVAVLRREDLFDLPRRNPWVWLAVMVLYPVLSVYPQELIFRSFLFHRYAPVFGAGFGLVIASAAAFGFVHIIFGSWFSVLASSVGGGIFAMRYLRTQSLFTASVEHSVYGMLVFTVGLGRYFYHGAAPAAGIRRSAGKPA